MKKENTVKEVVVVEVSTKFVTSFKSAYAVALNSTVRLAQTLCDAWHSGGLTQENLFASGEAAGKGIAGTDLSFPILAEACVMAALNMDDARLFLKGFSEGCGYGKSSSICDALKCAGYVGKRKGAGGREAKSKLEKASDYIGKLDFNEKELAAYKKMVAAM
jgi:hypothetical protein